MGYLIFVSVIVYLFICLYSLRLGIGVLLLLLPSYVVRFQIGFLPMTFLEVMIILLFVVWAVKRIHRSVNAKFKIQNPSDSQGISSRQDASGSKFTDVLKYQFTDLCPYLLPLSLFFLSATIAMLVSSDLRAAAGIWKAYFVESFVFLVVFVDVFQTHNPDLIPEQELKVESEKVKVAVKSSKFQNSIFDNRYLVFILLGGSVLWTGAIAIYQKFTGFMIPDPLWFAEATRRVTSIYGYPNAIGLYFAPIIVLFSGFLVLQGKKLINRNQKHQILYSIFYILYSFSVIAIGIAGIIFAVSQGAIIAVVCGSFVLFFYFKRLRKILILGSFVLLFCIAVNPRLNSKFIGLITFQDVSGEVRLALWEGTLDLIKADPFFGAGLSGFQKEYDEFRLARHTELLMYPHNLLLNFWVEIGILGLIAYLWILGEYFSVLIKIIQTDKKSSTFCKGRTFLEFHNQKFFSWILVSCMVTILTHGIVDVPYFKNDLSVLFMMFIGLSILTYQSVYQEIKCND